MSRKLLLIGLALQLAWAVLHGADGGASHRSRMQCGDKVGATLEGRTYAGVRGCAECILDGSATAVTCTRCAKGLYLKTDGGVTSCVSAAECSKGQFPTSDSNGGSVCVECSDTTKGGIDNCAECSLLTSKARSSTVLITCAKCSANALSPVGDGCLRECPAGSYETTTTSDNTKICTPCHLSCAGCNNDPSQNSCTSCYPGFVLSLRNGDPIGPCIPQCTEEFGINCEPGACTASIAGSKYCSKCKSGYVPVDGVCVPMTQRTISGCNPSEGVCTTCTAANYVLLSNGCYNTQAFPAGFVCLTANNGKCTYCTNNQTPDDKGSCPSCSEGCSLCPGSPEICLECLPGYYRSNNKCFKCTDSDTGRNPTITGIPNCVNCILLPGSSTLTCYFMQTPTVDPTDSSVNKGTFPAGAIAGISVVAVLVVGALISFLCWWFLCKTKRGGVSSGTTTLIR
ncbi:Variant-specific surface protein [Giardia duodenalis]|uniref:Variant-specific surface protein n=1 Tax=Giardia intestinalis TaxID=5741 RepID=V6TMZ6_GIAIN|nr:Variant-specific surface protein [Giardia intestinalis]